MRPVFAFSGQTPSPQSMRRPWFQKNLKTNMDNEKAVWLNIARMHRNPAARQHHERRHPLHGGLHYEIS
jgi:hypothetical protein